LALSGAPDGRGTVSRDIGYRQWCAAISELMEGELPPRRASLPYDRNTSRDAGHAGLTAG
jgi:hypothetical protein